MLSKMSCLKHQPYIISFQPIFVIRVCLSYTLVGIGNSSETDYVRGFTHYAKKCGYRVAVYNHVGALKNEKLTGNRMFTYGTIKDIHALSCDLI